MVFWKDSEEEIYDEELDQELEDYEDEDEEEEDEDDEEDDEPTITERVISWLWFFFKLGFSISIVLFFISSAALFALYKGLSERIPMVADSSYRPNLTTQVFDINGEVIARLHAEENRTRILTSSQIPQNIKDAVIAIEDERFYNHYGIDLVGITRAMVTNIRAGRIVQGASTLTQQLVKNAFLTSERTFQRKAVEAMMAFQLERRYSKDEILTLYLNEIYFGHGAYGLAAAAEMYFGKDPLELTLVESAMLASIPRSPVAFSPVRNPDRNRSRRSLVLSKMVELGYITPAEYEEAMNADPELQPLRRFKMEAPYFSAYVRDQLLARYGANVVYKGGLKVYTTLDLRYQAYAEQAMASAAIFAEYPMEEHPEMNGSLITINPRNGHIKAMYGGRCFQQSQFNRVTQANRQPGSSFKPFVFAAALESGMLPSDIIVDEPISYTNPWTRQVWSPSNYDNRFHGAVTLMKALCRSFNIPAVKLIDELTPARVIRLVNRLGIFAELEPNLSLALGSAEFTPMEMASAYGVFVNGGILVRPLSILRVEDRDGNILEENLPRAEEVMDAVNAAILTDMLKIAVDRGTGRRAMINGRAVAGKTGTTNNYVDAWFNGMTPELVTIVQFGFDMPRSLGPRKAGGAVAGPVWKQYMENVLQYYPKSDFPVPEGAVRLRVCMTSGDLASSDCPGAEVVSQVFPIESQPTARCNHRRYSAPTIAQTTDIEAEFATPAMNSMPDPDFFRVSYQQSQVSQTRPTPSRDEGWISREGRTEVSQNAMERWGVNRPIPPEAFIDESMANTPAVNAPQNIQNRQQQQPRRQVPADPEELIVSPPEIQFRSDYQ